MWKRRNILSLDVKEQNYISPLFARSATTILARETRRPFFSSHILGPSCPLILRNQIWRDGLRRSRGKKETRVRGGNMFEWDDEMWKDVAQLWVPKFSGMSQTVSSSEQMWNENRNAAREKERESETRDPPAVERSVNHTFRRETLEHWWEGERMRSEGIASIDGWREDRISVVWRPYNLI